jgi:hypothetical protein
VTGPERAIRWSTVAAVAAVALIAGWVSYLHAYEVVSAHGESGIVARLYPGTVDGLIYAASMVLLDAARRAVPAPPSPPGQRWPWSAPTSCSWSSSAAPPSLPAPGRYRRHPGAWPTR